MLREVALARAALGRRKNENRRTNAAWHHLCRGVAALINGNRNKLSSAGALTAGVAMLASRPSYGITSSFLSRVFQPINDAARNGGRGACWRRDRVEKALEGA